MITKEKFLEKYNISEDDFKNANISWEELEVIYEDFSGKSKHYSSILDDFLKEYISGKKTGLYSIHTRVKKSEHLIAKIVRKRIKNYRKYKNINKDNYEKYLTDLIGIRGLILFKEQWKDFHKYIIGEIENNPKWYVEDSERDFDEDVNHCYIAERPKAHIRNGDRRDIYEDVHIPIDIVSDRIYRAVHYIVKFHGVYLEIQIRTLPEESWGEVDHAVRYPYFQDEPILEEYTELLNRLSGLADEMGSFFHKMKPLKQKYPEQMDKAEQREEDKTQGDLPENTAAERKILYEGSTPYACLMEVLHE